jgi:uncharacterized damage-inducible protein DinB
MNQKLLRIFERAEADRKAILDIIKNLPEDKFSHRPVNKWSISQIIAHIILAERFSLQYMKKKSLGIDSVGKSGLWEDLKFFILKISQRIPMKYKAPKVLGESPQPLSREDAVRQWLQVRNELHAFISTLDNQHVKKKIYKHPVSGRLNVMQAVSFFREHANHHLPQIKRLL